MTKDILYLGSQSPSRQKLLKEVSIPFIVVPHTSDEQVVKGEMSFEHYVMAIAQEKMGTLLLPQPSCVDKPYLYVLTADTLVHLVSSGCILGKPNDLDDAKNMMRRIRNEEVEVITGCCLRRYQADNGIWQVEKESVWATGALVEFCIAEEFLDSFYDNEPNALFAAGATIIDGYGQLFFKSINGSHSAVIGLPLFELHQELKTMSFVF